MDSKIGVEIECEGVEKAKRHLMWRVDHEPMLKGGVEYVLKKPLQGVALSTSVYELTSLMKEEVFTQRCSTHIHVNVNDMNRVQKMNFITLYIMFERVLLSLVEESRVGNVFCLPVFDSNSVENVLCSIAEKEVGLEDLGLDHWKYSAINLASIGRLGSLEFRALHGTKDPVEIMNWVNLHLRMKAYAGGLGVTPETLVMDSSAKGFVGLFKEVFGDLAEQFEHLNLEELILDGMHTVQYYAFTGDWS